MMQHNQVFVIQVSNGTKPGQLALPAPPEALLPSEVKYSASLVRGLGFTHLVLAAVLFALGILGSWVEPETCWSGAGVWAGITAFICGISGLLAHRLWYKNFTIKAFLVSTVASVIINLLALILLIYAIVNRYKHFRSILEQLDQYPWFKPYDMNGEHQLTLSVSANLVVGFILELLISLWSVKVGWRGVQAPDFTANQNEDLEQQSVANIPHNGQQVPLAALYQLLQTHPELLGPKNMGGVGAPWEEHATHRSMDYQERVNRFLSHAIQDQSHSFPRSLSTVASEPSPEGSSSGGRGSPTDTLPILPDNKLPSSLPDNKPPNSLPILPDNKTPNPVPIHNQGEGKKRICNSELVRLIRSENKNKPPAPKHDKKKVDATNPNSTDYKDEGTAKTEKRENNEPKISTETRRQNSTGEQQNPSGNEKKSDTGTLKNKKESPHKETKSKEMKEITDAAQTSKLIDRNPKEPTNAGKTEKITSFSEPAKESSNREKLEALRETQARKSEAQLETKSTRNQDTQETKSEKKLDSTTERKETPKETKQTPEKIQKTPETKQMPEKKQDTGTTETIIIAEKKQNTPEAKITPEKKQGAPSEPQKIDSGNVSTTEIKSDNVNKESTELLDQLTLTDIQPPCEFQDT